MQAVRDRRRFGGLSRCVHEMDTPKQHECVAALIRRRTLNMYGISGQVAQPKPTECLVQALLGRDCLFPKRLVQLVSNEMVTDE